jgi:hypothetical protein
LEEMDVDDDSRGSKRKREDTRDPDYQGSDELEDEEEEKRAKPQPKRRTGADDSKKRSAFGMGVFNNPPCDRCYRRNERCEQNAAGSSCVACYQGKARCARDGEGRRNVAALKNTHRPKKREPKVIVESEDSEGNEVRSKGKGKGEYPIFAFSLIIIDHSASN